MASIRIDQCLRDNSKLVDIVDSDKDVIELCLGGRNSQLLAFRKRLQQPRWTNVKLFTELNIKSYGAGLSIGTINEEIVSLQHLKNFILTLTGIPATDQVLLTNQGNVIDKESQLDFSIDIYVTVRQGASSLADITVKWGMRYLKSIKLAFLTKVEILDAENFNTVRDIKLYVQKTFKIVTMNQVLFHGEVKVKESEKLFDMFLKEDSTSSETLNLSLIVDQKPFDVKIIQTRELPSFSMSIEENFTIYQIKLMAAEWIRTPVKCFDLYFENFEHALDEEKTLLDYDAIENYESLKLTAKTILQIRLHFEEPDEIREESIWIDEVNGETTLYQHLKKIRKKNGLRKREMVLIPDDGGYCWVRSFPQKYRLIDLLNFSLDFHVVPQRRIKNCLIM